MPVIKSAKKQMRQSIKRRERNFPVRSKLMTMFKSELQLIKEGNLVEAVKFLPKVYSIIDMATKKKIIEKNNASRKKSRLAKALNTLQTEGAAPKKVEEKAAPKAKKEKVVAEEVVEKVEEVAEEKE